MNIRAPQLVQPIVSSAEQSSSDIVVGRCGDVDESVGHLSPNKMKKLIKSNLNNNHEVE